MEVLAAGQPAQTHGLGSMPGTGGVNSRAAMAGSVRAGPSVVGSSSPPGRASRPDSRCPKGPEDHLVSFSAFLLSLCLQLQPYRTPTLQISKLQKQLSNSGGRSFSICGHPSCLLTRGARTVTVVQSEGHAHRCSLACAQGGFEGL